ncbi:MAG: hypothetical protein ACR2RF_00340 [Geminicoccaceae bacterium]
MTTVRSVITDSLRNLTVTPVSQEPSAEESAKGLTSFNNMMHGLKAEGADMGWATLTLPDTVPVAPEYIQPITDLLMRYLAMPFQVTLTPNQAEAATKGKRTLQAAFSTIPDLFVDPGLRDRVRHSGGDEVF